MSDQFSRPISDVVSASEEEPIFVFAAGWRSGSTFLQRLLLPHCFVWGEPYGRTGMIEAMANSVGAFIDGAGLYGAQ